MMTISKIAPCQQMAFQGKVVNDPNAAIVERIQAGDADALQELWSVNKGLAAHLALRYSSFIEQRNDIDIDDLIQAGYIGIHKATEKYRSNCGAKFSTYAVYFIKKEMRRTLGISKGKQNPSNIAISLNAPLIADGEHDATLGDTIADNMQCDWWEESGQWEAIRAAVGRMSSDICGALIAYYWIDKTTKEIATDYKVTPNTIWYRVRRGLDSLRRDNALRKWATENGYSA